MTKTDHNAFIRGFNVAVKHAQHRDTLETEDQQVSWQAGYKAALQWCKEGKVKPRKIAQDQAWSKKA